MEKSENIRTSGFLDHKDKDKNIKTLWIKKFPMHFTGTVSWKLVYCINWNINAISQISSAITQEMFVYTLNKSCNYLKEYKCADSHSKCENNYGIT